jgi:hypothetical protein
LPSLSRQQQPLVRRKQWRSLPDTADSNKARAWFNALEEHTLALAAPGFARRV